MFVRLLSIFILDICAAAINIYSDNRLHPYMMKNHDYLYFLLYRLMTAAMIKSTFQ